jgi:L-fuconolactonase
LPKDFDYWKKGIDELALRPNVNCKISGILTRVGKDWTLKEISPYVHYAIEHFGFDRLVYGGDWPVVLRADSYLAWSRAFEKLTRPYSKDELHKLYHLNADRIYQLGD